MSHIGSDRYVGDNSIEGIVEAPHTVAGGSTAGIVETSLPVAGTPAPNTSATLCQLNIFRQAIVYTHRDAARIAHEYMRDILGEQDLSDISDAAILRDLYDCGACVNHVAQVYLRGIMAPVSERVFGMTVNVTSAELASIERRLLDPATRLTPRYPSSAPCPGLGTLDYHGYRRITREDIEKLPTPMVIDVGSHKEYLLNPHLAGDDLFRSIVYVCETGHTAAMAAEGAVRSGYKNVYAVT